MRVYPLIYSRTRNFDYISSFLVRPADIDYEKAAKYVNAAMNNIKFTDGIRYTAFLAGDYAVYGMSCYSSRLIEILSKEWDISELDYQEYQTDKSGRPLVFFMGVAIKKSEYHGNIPILDLYELYEIYLNYLKHQFNADTPETELTEGIEWNETEYPDEFVPKYFEHEGQPYFDGRKFLENFDCKKNNSIIYYYISQILKCPDEDISFLSDILSDDINNSVLYTVLSIKDTSVQSCIAKLERKKAADMTENTDMSSAEKKNERLPDSVDWNDRSSSHHRFSDKPDSVDWNDRSSSHHRFSDKLEAVKHASKRKALLALFPEFEQLNQLTILLKLLDTPDFNGKSDFSVLSELAQLSEFKGLEPLKKLKQLEKLKKKR